MNSSRIACVETAKLPPEIMEHVLSFLTVPELCRIRSVCKSWNQIVTRPSFHDLCDVNGRSKQDELYMFMWSEVIRTNPIQEVIVNPFSATLSFLDVNARRWYSIPAANLPRVCACGHMVESQLLAMNEGLVCEMTSVKHVDKKFALAIMDPVAKTRRILPAPPEVFVFSGQGSFIGDHIVTAVNDATRSYKVFLLNNHPLHWYPALRAQARVYVHDSFTDEWRALRNVPNGVDEENWALSAVVLHESLFVLKQNRIMSTSFSNSLSLFRYRFQEDTWAEVYETYFPRKPHYAELTVSSNRLFLNVWLGSGRSSDPTLNPLGFNDPGLRSDPDCPHPAATFRYPNTCFEMYEVLVAEYRRKPVLQLTDAQLTQIFGMDSCELDLRHAFPCVGSNGICSSVVLVRDPRVGFGLRKYNLATGSVDVLPPHPLLDPSDASESIGDLFNAKTMKLSLRNILAQRPKVTSTGWRLLQ